MYCILILNSPEDTSLAMPGLLDNYNNLVSRVNDLCREIDASLTGQITCSAGCSSCCTAITIFPVEAAALGTALSRLPPHEAAAIRRHVTGQADGERCPLLADHRCLLYTDRPIICRTHGLPVIVTQNDQRQVDCCPRNPIDTTTLTGSHIIDLDRLNPLLVAINALFLTQSEAVTPERLTIAMAVLGTSCPDTPTRNTTIHTPGKKTCSR